MSGPGINDVAISRIDRKGCYTLHLFVGGGRNLRPGVAFVAAHEDAVVTTGEDYFRIAFPNRDGKKRTVPSGPSSGCHDSPSSVER